MCLTKNIIIVLGLKIIIDDDPCVIIEEEFNKPGKGQAFSKIKYRNYIWSIKTDKIL